MHDELMQPLKGNTCNQLGYLQVTEQAESPQVRSQQDVHTGVSHQLIVLHFQLTALQLHTDSLREQIFEGVQKVSTPMPTADRESIQRGSR